MPVLQEQFVQVKTRRELFLAKLAAVFCVALYCTTGAAWAFTLYVLFDKGIHWLVKAAVVGYLWYIIWGPGAAASRRQNFPKIARAWPVWRHLAAYFPIRLVKTAELDPSGKYVFGFHPHGVLTLSIWATFASDGAGYKRLFPGLQVHPATLRWNFITPLARELMLSMGFTDASRGSLLSLLRRPGHAVLLAIGGADESLLSFPGTYDLILNKRKGFVRIALQSGASLVPVLSFGETDIVTRVRTSPRGFVNRVQKLIKRSAGFNIPLFHGEGLFGNRYGALPHRRPITTVVGAPISVPHFTGDSKSPEFNTLVDEYHEKYIAALKGLWEEYKDKYAADRVSELRIVA